MSPTRCQIRKDDDARDARARIRDRLSSIRASDHEPNGFTSESTPISFATHGSFGVVDLGATKTVIGSHKVEELIESLNPEVRKRSPSVQL